MKFDVIIHMHYRRWLPRFWRYQSLTCFRWSLQWGPMLLTRFN